VIRRSELYWADLGPPFGSRPAYRRPVVVVQADSYTDTGIATVLAVEITSNRRLATMPGNVFLPSAATGLPRDSVANVTSLATLNKFELIDFIGSVPMSLMQEVDRGLRHVLDL
jgi:mRNA interferase MazF